MRIRAYPCATESLVVVRSSKESLGVVRIYLGSSPLLHPFYTWLLPLLHFGLRLLTFAYVCLTCALRVPYVCLTYALRLLTFAYVCLRIQMSYVVNEHVHSGRNRSENARIFVRIRAYPCVSLRTSLRQWTNWLRVPAYPAVARIRGPLRIVCDPGIRQTYGKRKET